MIRRLKRYLLDFRVGIACAHGPYAYSPDNRLECGCGYVMPKAVQREMGL